MSIQVRFFASLRERLGRGAGAVEAAGVVTAADVWTRAAGDEPMPMNTLIAVNMEYAEPGRKVKDGDEVAFFPPVTGG